MDRFLEAMIADLLSQKAHDKEEKTAFEKKSGEPPIRRRDNVDITIDAVGELPGGIVECMFADGSVERAVCDPHDKYDLRRGIEVCVLHKIFGGMKEYNNYFDGTVKLYKEAVAKEKEELRRKSEERKAKAAKHKAAKKKVESEKKKQQFDEEQFRKDMQEFITDVVNNILAEMKNN